MSMENARGRELQFFHGRPDYVGLKNVGTGYLSTELSDKLIASVRRQLPNISGFVNKSVMDLQKELEAMGGPAATSRGEMIHLVLTMCRKFEVAYTKLIDGGKGGESVVPWAGLGGGSGGGGAQGSGWQQLGSDVDSLVLLRVPRAGQKAGGSHPAAPPASLTLASTPLPRPLRPLPACRRRAHPDCV